MTIYCLACSVEVTIEESYPCGRDGDRMCQSCHEAHTALNDYIKDRPRRREAMVGFACAVCKCPCELWGCSILNCKHPTEEEFKQAKVDFDDAEPCPYSKEQMEKMVKSIVNSKSCTCLGSCRGVQGLGVGWRCVLSGEEGKANAQR